MFGQHGERQDHSGVLQTKMSDYDLLAKYVQDESAPMRSYVFDADYDTVADRYQFEITFNPNSITKIFLDLIPQYGKTCLDVGMAFGAQYFALQRQYPDVVWTGVDIIQTYIDKFQARGGKGDTLLVNSYLPMPEIKDNAFDVVTSRSALNHYSPGHGFGIINEMLRIASKAVIIKFIQPHARWFTAYSYDDSHRGSMRMNVVWTEKQWREYIKDKKATGFGKEYGYDFVWVLEK